MVYKKVNSSYPKMILAYCLIYIYDIISLIYAEF